MADAVDVEGGECDGGRNKRNEKENLTNSVLDAEIVTGIQKDGDAQKNKEREERLRLARERQKEEQRRKMEELRDSMLRAEEFRKRQEEERRKKIEEMKKREEEHRATVEERRKKLLDEENERKQAILRRTAEREAKLEQVKSKKVCASGVTSVALRSANSAQNISHQSRTGSVLRIASSVRDIHNGCLVQQDRDGDQNSSTASAAAVVPFSIKHFPASTGHLLKNPKRKTDDGVNLRSLASSADVIVIESKSEKLIEDGSVSPSKNGRARSTGSIRRSRADVAKGFDQLAMPVVTSTSEMSFRHSSSNKIMPSQTVRRARSVSSRPSKLQASPVLAPTTKGGKVPSKQMVAKSAKAVTPLGGSTTPSTKTTMPSPPKPMTPRSLPRELKLMKEVTTSNKPITSNKVKAVHQVNQVQTFSVSEQLSNSTDVKEIKELEVIEQLTLTDLAEATSPEKADVMKKSVTEEDEYKLKLAENRRLAREKAERDAESERLRIEKQRQEEEEQIRREEEEERRREEEELRLAEEAVRLEAERFQRAVEEEKRRRQEEEDRLEAERKEKLEAEKRAEEESERKEKERAEKAKREEEERIERKKRLEMIMKRVKTDETPVKVEAVPSVKSAPESCPTVDNTSEVMAEPPTTLASSAFPAQMEPVDNESSQFRSPLLRQMLGNKLKPRPAGTTEVSTAMEENSETGEKDQENCKVALNIPHPVQDFSSEEKKAIAEPEGENVDLRKEGVTSSNFVSDSRALLEPNADRIAMDEPLLVPLSNGMGEIESNQAEERDKPGKAQLHLEGLSQGLSRSAMSVPRNGNGRDGDDDDDDDNDDEKEKFDAMETGEPHEASGLLVPDEEKNGSRMLFSGSGASNGDKVGAVTTNDLLIDLSLPSEEPAAGTSVPIDTEDSGEMGASSSPHLLPGKLANENLLTDSTNSGSLDELINLSMPAADVSSDGSMVSDSGQTLTPSPNGIPQVAFEDNSNIQLTPLNDVIL